MVVGSSGSTPPPGRTGALAWWLRKSRRRAVPAAVLALALPVLGSLLYGNRTSGGDGATGLRGLQIVDIALGGRDMDRHRLIGLRGQLRSHLLWDLWFIAFYGAGFLLGALLLLAVVRSELGRRWAHFGIFAVAVAVVADLVENGWLAWALRTSLSVPASEFAFDAASAAAVLKWSALVPAALIALVGAGIVLGRAAVHLSREDRRSNFPRETWPALPLLAADPARSALDPSVSSRDRWRRGYNTPACGHPRPGIQGRRTGIALSGGGIRAASVALGVLQSHEFRTAVVPEAEYLVSVSGGGYTAGAFQQHLTPAGARNLSPDEPIRSPDTAFMPGTVEEDHVRRHSSYLASTPVELLTALGLLARHLLLTVVLLFGPAVLLGVAVGLLYRAVPVTLIGASVASAPDADGARMFPEPRLGAWWALGILFALAAVVWLFGQRVSANRTGRWKRRRERAVALSLRLAQLGLVAAALTVVVPAVIWASAVLLHQLGGTAKIASPIGGLLLAYGASIASVAWRHRKLVTDKATGLKMPTSAPRGALQLILVVVTLIVLALGWLLLFGASATVGLRPLSGQTWILLGVIALVVLFLGGVSDETTLSLHPFYRGRLATAFAVRRVRREDGETVARPYPPDERTALSEYGRLQRRSGFPHVIFAAAATMGEKRAAPGGQRTSYTFCSHWVGGPDLGYVRAGRLRQLAPPRLQRDLTVQGAVALSGAAIAASVGGQRTAWYETLFVVTGLRLGAWMPNPVFVHDTFAQDLPWHRPGLPRVRRLGYLLRQLFGVHSIEAPLVQVTDGGFYDNLGLVELFRRGCKRIYCIDASGDNPPAATTLAEALTLAYHELGVETVLEQGTWSTFTAGSADPLTPKDALAALNARLSQSGIITGTFTYPAGSEFADGGKGVLVVAKSALWPDLPYQVLAHAQGADPFPRDSTGDQFFDDRQYAAYTALGRELGRAAVKAMGQYDAAGNRTGPGPAYDGEVEVGAYATLVGGGAGTS
jgi:hypothetical protein